jgi:hypothetical protein
MSWLAQHLLYIPFAVGLGFLAGFNLGSRSVRNEWARAEKRRKQDEGA